METVDNAEVRIAVSEFHQYLSDRIAPLMFTDSAELLLQYPASALAGEVNRWKGAQASRAPGISAADFLPCGKEIRGHGGARPRFENSSRDLPEGAE